MEKVRVQNIAGVGIVYREQNPAEVLVEMKDSGYPMKAFRSQLNIIGGNWIGEGALNDRSPMDTFRREFSEELSFERPLQSSDELAALDLAEAGITHTTFINATPNEGDRASLALLRAAASNAISFGDFVNTIPKSVLDAADPENNRDGFTALCSYFTVPLSERTWKETLELQKKFGNISNESISIITSLDEIVSKRLRVAFGHDRVLKSFFLSQGLNQAHDMVLVPGIGSEFVHMNLLYYDNYLRRYDVAKRPQ